MVLTGSFVLSPAIGLFVTVIGVMCKHLANLMPASRHQNHTTSPSASECVRQCTTCVHRIPPRVRDDRDTPLGGVGQFGCKDVSGREKFFEMGLDRANQVDPVQ
jgi:hypothetical protein